MRRAVLTKAILVGLVVGMLLTMAGVAGPSPSSQTLTAQVSYNPAPVHRSPAPLSTPGILGAMEPGPDYLALTPANVNGATITAPNTDPAGMTNVSVNALRFIVDDSYMPQSETRWASSARAGRRMY